MQSYGGIYIRVIQINQRILNRLTYATINLSLPYYAKP